MNKDNLSSHVGVQKIGDRPEEACVLQRHIVRQVDNKKFPFAITGYEHKFKIPDPNKKGVYYTFISNVSKELAITLLKVTIEDIEAGISNVEVVGAYQIDGIKFIKEATCDKFFTKLILVLGKSDFEKDVLMAISIDDFSKVYIKNSDRSLKI